MIISKTPLRISFIGGGTDHLINENSYSNKNAAKLIAINWPVIAIHLKFI